MEQGATKEEISETLGMAIYMGAGPSVMYASHALEAFTQFEASTAKPSDKPSAVRDDEKSSRMTSPPAGSHGARAARHLFLAFLSRRHTAPSTLE